MTTQTINLGIDIISILRKIMGEYLISSIVPNERRKLSYDECFRILCYRMRTYNEEFLPDLLSNQEKEIENELLWKKDGK